ncbi:hypothetical protein ID866_5418 [Astraeus odoratus]|nr:hypothetical protein ID866_5418 [Astraeus odoratus]
MAGFAALMALSASQTKEAQNTVQSALLQRQRNEEMKRKKQEELERKERDEQAKLRQRHFEEEKRQRELEAKRAAEMERLEAEKARREEEARHALLYGPKKTKWPTSSSTAKDDIRKRRFPSDDDDDGSRSGSPAMALTREEKRQRRLDAEMRRTYSMKRSSGSSGYSKAGRRLPGGAIDATSAPSADSGAGTQSVKARLTALPNTLTKLNVNKRDTRTIDEILQDRAKAKHSVLDGDEAREFNDWFGKSKRKDPVPSSSQSTGSQGSAPASGAASPLPSSARSNSQPMAKGSAASKSSALPSGKSASSTSQPRAVVPAKAGGSAVAKSTSEARGVSIPAGAKSVPSKALCAPVKGQSSRASPASRPATGSVPSKKRPRSPSCSVSPPPKRRAESPADAIRSEIWKMFGKDRTTYMSRDIDSDDDDMEADASAVMKEELRSTRLAKREDELALLEEKRHEEEKRRRKREKEMKERRG